MCPVLTQTRRAATRQSPSARPRRARGPRRPSRFLGGAPPADPGGPRGDPGGPERPEGAVGDGVRGGRGGRREPRAGRRRTTPVACVTGPRRRRRERVAGATEDRKEFRKRGLGLSSAGPLRKRRVNRLHRVRTGTTEAAGEAAPGFGPFAGFGRARRGLGASWAYESPYSGTGPRNLRGGPGRMP